MFQHVNMLERPLVSEVHDEFSKCYDLVHFSVLLPTSGPGRIDDQTVLERHTESPRFSGPAQCCSEFRGGCVFTSHDGEFNQPS